MEYTAQVQPVVVAASIDGRPTLCGAHEKSCWLDRTDQPAYDREPATCCLIHTAVSLIVSTVFCGTGRMLVAILFA